MKTLKKVLSLVLVVAMIASMLIVGAAAAEETNYDEAVAVVTGLGIIEGDGTGMNFTGNVTREQAAKIIAYLLLGKDTAEALKTSAAPFADVAATRWSAGYIAYLKGQGIISGVSDTEFDPTAPVTGIAFAKMLLVAAGYGANGEFEGKDWDINTITYANDNGVFTGTLAADLAAAATREEAMLYAFNLLTKVPVVKYNKTFESYYTGTSALSPVTGEVDPDDASITADDAYYYTLGYSKYALKQTTTGTADLYGRPAATWTAAGVFVADAVANVTPDAILYGTVYSLNLYNTFGKTVVNNINSQMTDLTEVPATERAEAYTYYATAPITYYVDGVEQTSVEWQKIVTGEYVNGLGGTGATVELYLSQNPVDGKYSLTVVAWFEHIGQVSRVVTASGVTTVTIADKGVDGGTVEVTSEAMDVTGLAKKDMVLFTKGMDVNSNTVVTSVKATAPIVGTYNNFVEAYYMYTIDGAFYSVNAKGDNIYGLWLNNLDTYGNSYELYLDSFGNLMYAELYEEGESANQYLYVQKAEAQGYVDGVLDGQEAKVALTVLYPNGGKAVVYPAVKFNAAGTYFYITVDGNDYVLDAANIAAINAGTAMTSIDTYYEGQTEVPYTATLDNWMRYTVNEAGDLSLKTLNANYALETAVTVAPAKATTGTSYTANSATVLTLIDGNGNAVVYTGISNFVDKSGTALVTYGLNSKVAKSITLVVPNISSAMNLAYCAQKWTSDDNGTTYMFYVDGVAQYITTESSCAVRQVYDLDYTDGVWTASLVGGYTDTEANDDAGIVNAANAGAFGVQDSKTYAWSYYETATIDTVDETYFTTVEVTAEDAADSVIKTTAESKTYYYDANTVVYDLTGAGATTVSEGDVFVAYVDEAASAAYAGEMYVSVVWIVA